MASLCNGCKDNYMSAFSRFYDKDDVALHFLREHGVLPGLPVGDCQAYVQAP